LKIVILRKKEGMPMTSLLDRLSAERNRRFVGRGQELELFLHAIASPELPFHILHVFGPGGVGKTTLMQQFLRFSERSKIPVIYVEGRNISCHTGYFHHTTPEDLSADPGAIASWQYLQNHAPLRPTEGATIFRFWMARDTYQVVSPTQEQAAELLDLPFRVTSPMSNKLPILQMSVAGFSSFLVLLAKNIIYSQETPAECGVQVSNALFPSFWFEC
jgi:AAA ATPase domain